MKKMADKRDMCVRSKGDKEMGRWNWGWKVVPNKFLSALGLNMQEGKRHAPDRMNWSDVVYRGQDSVNGLNQSI